MKTITYDDSLYCLVPIKKLKLASESIGAFCSDHGWAQDDMDNMDSIDEILAIHKASHTNIPPEQEPDAMRAAGQCCCDDSE